MASKVEKVVAPIVEERVAKVVEEKVEEIVKVIEHRLISSRSVDSKVHGSGRMGGFNAWLAVKITGAVGTMPMAYIFAAIALVALPAALATRQPLVIVAWIAQTFLQLVLLPIIIVGQNVISSAQDARAETDHETLSAIHDLTTQVKGINDQQLTILETLSPDTLK